MPPPSRQGWGQVQELQAPPRCSRHPPRQRWRCARVDHCAGAGDGVRSVLEQGLDDPGLVATSGALNPLDVLVIGGQDGL